MKTLASFLVLCLLSVLPTPVFSTLQEVREVHYQMGTSLELTLWHSEADSAKRLIREAVQEVHRLEEVLSNFDAESAVSQFNHQAGKGKISLHPDLYDLLKQACWFSAKTGGYFDVTVGPLMKLWRESASLGHVPSAHILARVLRSVGYRKLKLYDSGQAELLLPGMTIDLGGIGKGYAVDRLVDRFKKAGINAALINFGGSSIYAIGAPPGKKGWEIGVQGTDGQLRGVIHLRDLALSTSGSMGRFWTVGGKNYGHLIDPKSGIPVSEPRMATVITSTATAAEALTKPLALHGKNALRTIGRLRDTEAVISSAQERLFFSKGFQSKTGWQEISRL